MKWFHHECAAKHDPKLQTLGDEFGAEGLGIYWGLLEEIGQHSDTFHLKVLGNSREADTNFDLITQGSAPLTMNTIPSDLEPKRIPQLSVRLLAKNLFTSTQKLTKVLDASVKIGLFDSVKWLQYNVLYSPSFEQRADDYTRRQRKHALSKVEGLALNGVEGPERVRTSSELTTNNVRTIDEHNADALQRMSDNVRPEQITEQKQKRTEEDQNSIQACTPIESKPHTSYSHREFGDSEAILDPTESQYQKYAHTCRKLVVDWNASRKNKFTWSPDDSEIRKLFYGGSRDHKLMLCYQAFNINHERINYPALVLRAVRLMLRSSEKKRIQNPTGWLWSCLHGNGDGTTPWVQLLTADEENSVGTHINRAIAKRSGHPP